MNQIDEIIDADGGLCTSQEEIEGAFINFYQKLFTSESPTGVEECLYDKPRKVTREMNSQLLQPFSVEEVSSALNQMALLKALGLDGFSVEFYQEGWAIIDEEVCKVVIHFFATVEMDGD